MNQLTPELSELISEVEFVVFIDATHVGRPGSWKCETIEPKESSPQTFGHHLTPASLLDFAQAIFKASPPAVLVSVAGSCFDSPRTDALRHGCAPRRRTICAGENCWINAYVGP